jgi:hypothetical protein
LFSQTSSLFGWRSPQASRLLGCSLRNDLDLVSPDVEILKRRKGVFKLFHKHPEVHDGKTLEFVFDDVKHYAMIAELERLLILLSRKVSTQQPLERAENTAIT